MKATISLFTVVILAVTTLSAQSRKQVKEWRIKSMTETTVVYKDGKETVTYKSQYKVFDKYGNTTQDVEYGQDGSVKRKETTTYTGDGEEKTEEVIERSAPGTSAQPKYERKTWKYNEKGDETEEVEYDAGGNVIKKITYAYAKSGNRMFEMEYDGAGNLLKKTAYGYDSKGLRTEKKIFGPGDVLLKHVKYTYTY